MPWIRFLPLSYEQLGHLSYNLATCLAAGIELPRAFRTATRSYAAHDKETWEAVAERLEVGDSLADALRMIEHRLPPFYLPLIGAGEQTGRLAEVLHYLATHCRLLARPRQALRNVWLVPLSVYLAGIPIKLAIVIFTGALSRLWPHVLDAIGTLGSLAAVAVLLLAPPLKPAWDRLRLIIPVLGRSERDLAVSRFLRVFAMLYATGGMRVENMIRFAARSVDNDFLRRDLSRCAKRIEQGENLASAFSVCLSLSHEEKQTIAAGELSGTLEAVCERLAANLDEALEARLKAVTAFAVRVMMFLVSLSLFGTGLGIVSAIVLG